MIPVEKGMVNSQFLITFRPVSGLNGKRVVSFLYVDSLHRMHILMKYLRTGLWTNDERTTDVKAH